MFSPESRHTTLKNIIRTGAVLMVIAAASSVRPRSDGPEISISVGQHNTIDVGGEAFVGRSSKDEFLVFDKEGGLAAKDSVSKAKEFMIEKGCKIADVQESIELKGEKIGEFVKVRNPQSCLPELK